MVLYCIIISALKAIKKRRFWKHESERSDFVSRVSQIMLILATYFYTYDANE